MSKLVSPQRWIKRMLNEKRVGIKGFIALLEGGGGP